MFYSDGVYAENVAIVMRKYIVKFMTKVQYYSDRLILVKISAKLVYTVIVQEYMPKTNHDDKKLETNV